MIVRVATDDDVDAVASLEAATLGVDAWSYGLVAEGVRGNLPTISYLLAEHHGAPIGHAVVSIAGDIAELQRIGVLETARRHGVAGALLDAVLARAEDGGADRVLLEVREDNTGALAFYAARGFIEIDRRARYYRDGGAAVVMRRGLVKGC